MPLTRRLALMAAAVPAAALLLPRPAAAAGLLAALKSGSRTLIVGTDATFPPFEQTSTGGVKSGFDLDLVNAVAEAIGIRKVEFRQVPFGQLIPGLVADHIDLAASAIYITPVRAKVVNFT
ncbi:MAG: transporter substrate-binding domain-containing protein, partial [Acetobacteraceae bacterium]